MGFPWLFAFSPLFAPPLSKRGGVIDPAGQAGHSSNQAGLWERPGGGSSGAAGGRESFMAV